MSLLPTEDDIAHLPRMAQVAFAARCARRVQPIYRTGDEEPYPELASSLDKVIRLVETDAAYPGEVSEPYPSGNLVDAAADEGSRAVAMAVLAATECAINAIVAWHSGAGSGGQQLDAAKAAEWAARALSLLGDSEALHRIWIDFDTLRTEATLQSWRNDDGVLPEVFGPLWPDGKPQWVEVGERVQKIALYDQELQIRGDKKNQTDSATEVTPQFEITIDVSSISLTDRGLIERIKEFALAANALHRAQGGNGLKIDDIQIVTEAPVLEVAPRG